MNFQTNYEKTNPAFDKISLLLKTVLESEPRSLLSTVQLGLSWNLEMSDQQNDRFARPSYSPSKSLSAILLAKNSFTKIFLK